MGIETALIISGIAAAGASVGGAAISARGAGRAANAQIAASETAMDKELAFSREGLDLYRQMWEEEKKRWAPYQAAGETSLASLMGGLGAGGEFTKDFGAEDFKKDPGYDFRRAEGQKGVERFAASKGGLLSGAALKATTRFGQDYASNEYQNAYDRFNSDRTRRFNRLATIAGVGQAGAEAASRAGSNFAAGSGSILGSTGARLSDLITGAGNARASGYVGSANAWGQGIAGVGSGLSSTLLLSELLKQKGTWV